MFGGNQFQPQYHQNQQSYYQQTPTQSQQTPQQSQQSQQFAQTPQIQQLQSIPQQTQQSQPLNYQQKPQVQSQSQQQQQQFNPSYPSSPINERSPIQNQQYIEQQQQHQQQFSPQTQQNNQVYNRSPYYSQLQQRSPLINQPNATLYNDPNRVIKEQVNFTKQETEIFIEKSFKNKIAEWKRWTFSSALFIYFSIISFQLLVVWYLLSKHSISAKELLLVNAYLVLQFGLCLTHSLVIGVYRQVPASFKEFVSKLGIQHYLFIIANLFQIYFLVYYFLFVDSFSISRFKEICFQDDSDGYIVKCQTESNILFPLTLILSILLSGSIIFKSFANQEFVLSFPKANISTILQIKSTLYNGFWISFYSSFNFFCIGSILSVLLFILYRTFTIKIILYLCHLWCYSFIVIFQNFIRYRIFEIYYTRSLRFSVEKFVESNQSLQEIQDPRFANGENSRSIYHIRNINTPTIENPNVFLFKGIDNEDPLVQFLAWKDLLHISKYSESRRNQLFSQLLQMVERPTLLDIITNYENQILNLDAIFSTPREFYESNYKKNDGDNKNNNNNNNNNSNNKSNSNGINFLGKTINRIITQVTGIRFESTPYDSEIKQALSNTQSIIWSIEAIGSLIVLAQTSHDPQVIEYLHRYQVPQKFLAPLLRIISIVEKLESDLQFQIEMDRSTLVQEYYFIKSLVNQIEPPKNCFGILLTSRPHFRLFKQVGENTISQVLETIGNQISDISFPHDLRSVLNSYKSGEFSIYQ